MKLVMIHGRDQQGKDPDVLKQQWLEALQLGCERARIKFPTKTLIEFPFYGDVLAKMVDEIAIPLGNNINAKGPNPDMDETLRGEMIMELARNAGINDSDVLLEVEDPIAVEKGPGNWEWVQAVMRILDRIPGLNSHVIDRFTRDVYVYLAYPAVRAKIDSLIVNAFGNGPCVMLAHSLGSVVAYNVLRKREAQPSYPRFVTVGSPLGIRAIKQHLETPLVSPPCIKNWFNAYDDRDYVALMPLDAKNFNIVPAIENKNDVQNHTENRHGIEGYLADPIVAKKIVEHLKP